HFVEQSWELTQMILLRTRHLLLAMLVGLSLPLPVTATDSGPAGRASDPPSPGAADPEGRTRLFDGKSLGSWKRTGFAGGGEVRVEKSFRGGPPAVVVEAGSALSGFHWTREAPRTNYEVALEAMKIQGDDFMCGLTFPVNDS